MAPKKAKTMTIFAAGLACASGLQLSGENSADLQELSETMYANSQLMQMENANQMFTQNGQQQFIQQAP